MGEPYIEEKSFYGPNWDFICKDMSTKYPEYFEIKKPWLKTE